jgi:hypothetical protein
MVRSYLLITIRRLWDSYEGRVKVARRKKEGKEKKRSGESGIGNREWVISVPG